MLAGFDGVADILVREDMQHARHAPCCGVVDFPYAPACNRSGRQPNVSGICYRLVRTVQRLTGYFGSPVDSGRVAADNASKCYHVHVNSLTSATCKVRRTRQEEWRTLDILRVK